MFCGTDPGVRDDAASMSVVIWSYWTAHCVALMAQGRCAWSDKEELVCSSSVQQKSGPLSKHEPPLHPPTPPTPHPWYWTVSFTFFVFLFFQTGFLNSVWFSLPPPPVCPPPSFSLTLHYLSFPHVYAPLSVYLTPCDPSVIFSIL